MQFLLHLQVLQGLHLLWSMSVASLFGLESQARLVSTALGSSSCRIVHGLSKLQIAGMVIYGEELIAPSTSLGRVRAPPVTVVPVKWSALEEMLPQSLQWHLSV